MFEQVSVVVRTGELRWGRELVASVVRRLERIEDQTAVVGGGTTAASGLGLRRLAGFMVVRRAATGAKNVDGGAKKGAAVMPWG